MKTTVGAASRQTCWTSACPAVAFQAIFCLLLKSLFIFWYIFPRGYCNDCVILMSFWHRRDVKKRGIWKVYDVMFSPQRENSAEPIQATDAPARCSSLLCWLWLTGGCWGRWHSEQCSDRGAQCLGTQVDEQTETYLKFKKKKKNMLLCQLLKVQKSESRTWQSGFIFVPLAGLYWLGAAGGGEVTEGGGDLVSPSGLSPASTTSSSSSLTQSAASGNTRSKR